MKHLIIFTVLFISISSFGYEPELIVRADKSNPKALPVWSKMPSMSPSCSNTGLAVKYLSLFGDEKLYPAVSMFSKNNESHSKPFESDLSVSDLFITNNQSLIFALNYMGGTKGVFELDSKGTLTQKTNASDFPRVQAMSRPSLLDGKVLYRALNEDGLHTIFHGKEKILDEAGDVAYLYLPTVKNNQVALKVGLGLPGEVSQTNKDKILSITNGKVETISVDADLDSNSSFLGFDNSPIPDGDGGVAFIAEHKVHGRSLWHYKNKKMNMIFSSSKEEGTLEYFSPAVNTSGSIVFRIITNKRISVMAWDSKSQKLVRLMEQGQTVLTNEENTRVIDRPRWPAFSGKPCIADNGHVYINAVLENSINFENKGSGIFKIDL